MSIDHYENFPVASWLCPPALRPAVVAIYRFARTADDIADEGDASPAERLQQLADYSLALQDAAAGRLHRRWPAIFEPLAAAIAQHQLPLAPLIDLLSAFAQDTGNPLYADRPALLDYCSRSANPVGRLLLHLTGVNGRNALLQADAICTALQLINFWQDLSIDLPRGRIYVSVADAMQFGLAPSELRAGADSASSRLLVRELCRWARGIMLAGAPLVHQLPGRMAWELRFVVQGGLRVLERIEASGGNSLSHRPRLGKADWPLLGWRAMRMRTGVAALATTPVAVDEHRA